jgi:tetratricopeptide (TPR) repeat protein
VSSLSKFLNSGQIIVLDSNLAARVAVRQSLMELGAQANQISCVKNIQQAKQILESSQVALVIADYQLDDGIATSMLSSNRSFLFLLLSSNNSKAAIAKAAEDEVDEFLFKPYNHEDFRLALEGMASIVANPTEADSALQRGKNFLEEGALEKAKAEFEIAKQDKRTYAKACAYLGQVQKLNTDLAAAAKEYEEGLDSNQMHFKCLNGLYQTYFQQNRIDDAYRILKEIVMNFPENPERLAAAVYLAVKTENIKDIEIYHHVFELMTQKTSDSIKHLCSALSVAGHYHLRQHNTIQAMLSFERALAISGGEPKYIAYIQRKLKELGLNEEADRLAQQYLSKSAA